MPNTLTIMRGLPGSGKTTRAEELMRRRNHVGICRINRDDLRAMLHRGTGWWSSTREKIVRKVRDEMVRCLLAEGQDVIVDDTNLRDADMEHWKHLAGATLCADRQPARVQTIDLRHVDVEECIRRDQKRPNYVGEKVIRDMHRIYIRGDQWSYKPTREDLPLCVICDLDGTLADMGDRDPFDTKGKCIDDKPRQWVVDLISGIIGEYEKPKHLVIFSGRFGTDANVEATRRWLFSRGFSLDARNTTLVLREPGDHRRDSLVKREMFANHVHGKYNPVAVFDDRPQVCRECWEPLGLGDRLFKVGKIDEEF